ncbi:hypothetical protein ACLOJK_003391 [Asimina triloba]
MHALLLSLARDFGALTSAFYTSSLGTATVSTPFSIATFTPATFVFSGSWERLRNLSVDLSTLCHVSLFSSFSLLCSPLIWRILLWPESTTNFMGINELPSPVGKNQEERREGERR